jgi:heme oxygenase
VRKFRQIIRPTPLATAYALMLGYLEGLRGGRLFETNWTRVLDASPAELRNLAAEAKRLSGLDLKVAGDVIEVGFTTILTPEEIKDSRVTH